MAEAGVAERVEAALMPPVKRQIFPGMYAISIEPNPLNDDDQAKMLVVKHPLEAEVFMYPLNEEQEALLHDGTSPASGLIRATADAMPPAPPGGA